MINSKKIKARIVEMGMNQKTVAKALGLSQPAINQKINNVRPMDLCEAEKLCVLLNIKDTEFCDYFFDQKLRSATYS